MKKQIILGLALSINSCLAFAHPGHDMQGFSVGFLHPLTGWDHLLVMLAVGVLAAKIGGKARWQLPLTFMLMMLIGASLGILGIGFSGLETAIAASVMAMGLLICLSVELPAFTRVGLIASFALMHGMAHGAELQHAVSPLVGMLLSTGLLHVLGLFSGLMSMRAAKSVQNGLAILMFVAGGFMLNLI
ncbi:MAG: HupE/UreJ family protein [Methylophilaceae bacterium]